MFCHQERVAILLLVAVAVIVSAAHLLLVEIGKEPFAADYSESVADGSMVRLSGTIDKATVIENGGHILLSVKNTSIFIPASVAGKSVFAKGSAVTLYGTVQTYQGKKEIVIHSADDILVTA
ncbi:MAG: hypothetical protein WC342_09690 [Methanoregula sp.]|jgi:DNA/RNA endonuclease YhcR with UshA esterase domain